MRTCSARPFWPRNQDDGHRRGWPSERSVGRFVGLALLVRRSAFWPGRRISTNVTSCTWRRRSWRPASGKAGWAVGCMCRQPSVLQLLSAFDGSHSGKPSGRPSQRSYLLSRPTLLVGGGSFALDPAWGSLALVLLIFLMVCSSLRRSRRRKSGAGRRGGTSSWQLTKSMRVVLVGGRRTRLVAADAVGACQCRLLPPDCRSHPSWSRIAAAGIEHVIRVRPTNPQSRSGSSRRSGLHGLQTNT